MNIDLFQKIFDAHENIFVRDSDDGSKIEFDTDYKTNFFRDETFAMHLACK